ncbi:MAG TPA: class I SAM-dependent methyltransferase [Anaerolineales bacterium]|nr:class I SAM-dependent methyltransferase [Anaerolineales bacterium]
MTGHPQVWHYGLVARWWAEFNTDGPEIEYFKGLVERFGQPVLDVACGTGRLLLPFLRAGLDVDGADISPDMLALCSEKAQREGLRPSLYLQAMHELDIPRSYSAIVVCGGFALGGSRSQDQEALIRFFRHLQPGGALLLDNYLPYKDADEWRYWVKEQRQGLPEPWPPVGRRKRAENGDEIELRSRLAAFDPLDQVATRQIRALLWRDGEILQQEEHVLLERLYFRNELLAMLDVAGFLDVQVFGDYTEKDASADSGILIYVAKKEVPSATGPIE